MNALQAPAWLPAADADRWRQDMLAWTSGILARLGRPATGAPSVGKREPWSIVLQVSCGAAAVARSGRVEQCG